MADLKPRTDPAALVALADKRQRHLDGIANFSASWSEERITEIFALRILAAVVSHMDFNIAKEAGDMPITSEDRLRMREISLQAMLDGKLMKL